MGTIGAMSDATDASPRTPSITAAEGGPFRLSGRVPIRPADYVYAEDGSPMTWTFGEPLEVDGDEVALCRCGHSDDKPFCDGSHADAEWDASDAERPAASYAERARRKASPDGDYELLDDTKLCTHAGLCATAKKTVWQMMPDTDDPEVRGTVIRMVEKCPSGRLVNVIGGDEVEPSLPLEIGVVPGGPLWVTGGLEVTGASGEPLETRNRVTLCRCGASGNKPLCDGSHKDIEFEGIS